MRLVRVVAPHFVAGFETDGTVRRAAPIVRYLVGWDDDKHTIWPWNLAAQSGFKAIFPSPSWQERESRSKK